MSEIHVARILLSCRHSFQDQFQKYSTTSFQDQSFQKYETTSFSGSIFSEPLKDILFRINLFRKKKKTSFSGTIFSDIYPFQNLDFFQIVIANFINLCRNGRGFRFIFSDNAFFRANNHYACHLVKAFFQDPWAFDQREKLLPNCEQRSICKQPMHWFVYGCVRPFQVTQALRISMPFHNSKANYST